MLQIDISCAEHGFATNCQHQSTPQRILDIQDPENPEEYYHLDRMNGRVWYKRRETRPAETESFEGMYGWYWSDRDQVWWRFSDEPTSLL